MPDVTTLENWREGMVALECERWTRKPFNMSDLSQRKHPSLHKNNGEAEAWKEVAETIDNVIGVISGKNGVSVTFYPRL